MVADLDPRRRSIGRLVGLVVVAVGAMAIALALTGRSDGALKLVLFALVLPGLMLAGAGLIFLVRSPDWYRSLDTIFFAIMVCGAFTFLLAFLVWLPLSPDRWRFDVVPPLLRLPLQGGLIAFISGALLGVLNGLRADWHRRNRSQIAKGIFILGIAVWLVVSVLLRHPSV